MTFSNLVFALHDDVAIIRLCRQGDASNALGASILLELQTAIDQARNSKNLKAVILTGTGRTFSNGADLDEIREFDTEQVAAFLHTGQALLSGIMELDAVTIAAVNGLALGGGLELALACDLRWSHPRAVFGLPEARLGLVPGWGGLALLKPLVAPSVYEELISAAGLLTARRARAAGLINAVFEARDFEREILSQAGRLSARGAGFLADMRHTARRSKAGLDLASADDEFLRLWNKPERAVRLSAHAGKDKKPI